MTESAATDPRNVYAATKLHQEHLCTAYAREHGSSALVATHNERLALKMDRVLRLHEGHLA